MNFLILPPARYLILAAIGTGFASADLIWDADGSTVGTPNPFDGAGTWLDANRWWDTTLNAGAGGNFTWSNATNGPSSVQLGNGGLAGPISLAGGVTVGGIQFNGVVMPAGPTPGPAGTEEAYSFTGGTLTLGNNAILDLRTNSSTSNTGNGRIRFQGSSVIAGSNVSLTNANGGNTSLGLIQFFGSNTWNGNISMSGNGTGGLFIEALTAGSFNTASKITIGNNASFVINYASGTNNVPIDVIGTGAASRGAIRFDATQTLGGNITLTGGARITTNTSAGIVGTLSGNISGNFGLNLNSNVLSAGTILFKGSNTYTTLTVNRGNAQIGEGGVGTSGTGLTTLNQSTTAGVVAYVSGTGLIKNGLTVTAGQVRPGDSSGNGLGRLNVTGALTVNATVDQTIAQLQLTAPASTSDRISVDGAVTLNANGNLAVLFSSYTTPVTGDSWTLLDWTGAYTAGGFSTGANGRTGANTEGNEGDLDLPDLTVMSGYAGQTWNVALGTNSLVVSIVPEPSAVLLSGLGIVAIGLRRRRK